MSIKILIKHALKVIARIILAVSLLLLLYSTLLNDFNTRLLGFMLLPIGLVLLFIQKAIEQKINNQPMVRYILYCIIYYCNGDHIVDDFRSYCECSISIKAHPPTFT